MCRTDSKEYQARFDYFNEEVTWTAIEAVDQNQIVTTWAAPEVEWAGAQAHLAEAAWVVQVAEWAALVAVAHPAVAAAPLEEALVAHPVAWEALQEVPGVAWAGAQAPVVPQGAEAAWVAPIEAVHPVAWVAARAVHMAAVEAPIEAVLPAAVWAAQAPGVWAQGAAPLAAWAEEARMVEAPVEVPADQAAHRVAQGVPVGAAVTVAAPLVAAPTEVGPVAEAIRQVVARPEVPLVEVPAVVGHRVEVAGAIHKGSYLPPVRTAYIGN